MDFSTLKNQVLSDRNPYRTVGREQIEHIGGSFYKVDGVDYARTVFASFADSVIIVRLEAGKGGELDFKVSFDAPLEHSVKAADGTLSILCQGREQERQRGEGARQRMEKRFHG